MDSVYSRGIATLANSRDLMRYLFAVRTKKRFKHHNRKTYKVPLALYVQRCRPSGLNLTTWISP